MLGGDTLYELRTALQLAETERLGGIGAHVSPMVNVREVGALLSRSQFTLTTVSGVSPLVCCTWSDGGAWTFRSHTPHAHTHIAGGRG